MSDRQQNIIQLERNAEQLVENLKSLYDRAGSYKEAGDKLKTTNENLLTLVNNTQVLAEESHRIISEMSKFGSAKIFDKLDSLEAGQKDIIDNMASTKGESKKSFIILSAIGGAIIILQVVGMIIK